MSSKTIRRHPKPMPQPVFRPRPKFLAWAVQNICRTWSNIK